MNKVIKPAININLINTQHNQMIVQSIMAGIEEEGIPYEIIILENSHDQNVASIAHNAAVNSLLDVGMGIDNNGNVSLHYAKLLEQKPLFNLLPPYHKEELRLIGNNAARLIKGLPFRFAEV